MPLGAGHTPAIHVWLPLEPLKFRVCIQRRPKKGEPPACKRQPYSQVTPQRPWRLPARSAPTTTPPLIQALSTLSVSPLARRAPPTKAGWVQPSPTPPPRVPLLLATSPGSGMQLFLRYTSKALSNPGRVAGKQPAERGVGPGQALLWADD